MDPLFRIRIISSRDLHKPAGLGDRGLARAIHTISRGVAALHPGGIVEIIWESGIDFVTVFANLLAHLLRLPYGMKLRIVAEITSGIIVDIMLILWD